MASKGRPKKRKLPVDLVAKNPEPELTIQTTDAIIEPVELVPVYGRDDTRYYPVLDTKSGVLYEMSRTKPKHVLVPPDLAELVVKQSPALYSLVPFPSYTGVEKANDDNLVTELLKRGYTVTKA